VQQIVGILKQAERAPVAEMIRQVGISEQPLYRWKKQAKELGTDRPVSPVQTATERGCPVEETVAALSLDKTMLQDVLAKKTVTPSRCRPVVSYMRDTYRANERRACRVAQIPVSSYQYESQEEPRTALRLRIRKIAHVRVRYGYRKIRSLLNREGGKPGKKLVYRLFKGGRLDPATQAAEEGCGSGGSSSKTVWPSPGATKTTRWSRRCMRSCVPAKAATGHGPKSVDYCQSVRSAAAGSGAMEPAADCVGSGEAKVGVARGPGNDPHAVAKP
jgi:hypothetical protein